MKKCPCCDKRYWNYEHYCIKDGHHLVRIPEEELSELDKERDRRADYDFEHPVSKPRYTPRCPTCGSPNVQPVIVIFGIYDPAFRKSYQCNDCQYSW